MILARYNLFADEKIFFVAFRHFIFLNPSFSRARLNSFTVD